MDNINSYIGVNIYYLFNETNLGSVAIIVLNETNPGFLALTDLELQAKTS